MLISLFLSLLFSPAHAATCCGSNISTPALITTGEQIKLQIGQSQVARTFEVGQDQQPILLTHPKQFSQQSFKFGYLMKNDLQIYFQSGRLQQKITDSEFGIGQEVESETFASVFWWLGHSFPSGTAVYQLNNPADLPSGSGHHSTILGFMLGQNRAWGDYGGSFTYSYSHPYLLQGQGIKNPDLMMGSLGGGYSINRWRWGLQQSVVYATNSLYWPTSFNMSLLDGPRIWTLAYQDDSLLGPVKNTALNRTFNLSLIFRHF